MIVTSAFAGIGGIDLGISAAMPEAEIRFQIEIDPYCRKVLAKHWPEATRYEDVQTVEPADIAGTEILIAGVPCQDTSVASPTGTGLDGERSGLWREVKRLIRTVPTIEWLVVENVPGLLGRGMDTLLGDLSESGFCYVEWDCLSSASIGACHRRDRIWIIASRHTPNTYGSAVWEFPERNTPRRYDVQPSGKTESVNDGKTRHATDTDSIKGRECVEGRETQERETTSGRSEGPCSEHVTDPLSPGLSFRERMEGSWAYAAVARGNGWNIEPPVCPLDDGISPRLANRRNAIKALGNSVQPQVAYFVGKRLRQLIYE